MYIKIHYLLLHITVPKYQKSSKLQHVGLYLYLTYIVTGTLYYRWIPNLCLLNGSIMKSWTTQISIAEIYEQITLWTDLLRSYTTFAIMQFIMFLLRKQVNSVCVSLFYLGPDHLCQLQKIAACYFLLFIYGLLFQKIVNFFAYFPK